MGGASEGDVELAEAKSLLQANGGRSSPHLCWSFFSEQTRLRGLRRARREDAAIVHTPSSPGAAEALEVGVLALSGRAPSRPRRALLSLAALLGLLLVGLAAWAYPRDPAFTLSALQQGFGSAGVALVLAGALSLSVVWFPGSFARATTLACPLEGAASLLFYCEDGSQHPVDVAPLVGLDGAALRCAVFRRLRFVYSPEEDAFVVAQTPTQAADTAGLDADTAARRLEFYGPNSIEVPMPSIGRQLMDEARGTG